MDQADKLNRAAGKGDEEAVRRLLATGARADGQCQWGDLPLHEDSLGGHEGVVRLLLEAAPSTAVAANRSHATALHQAAMCGREGVVRLLLAEAPGAASLTDSMGQSPLHVAATAGYAGTVQLLLEAAPEMAFAPDASGRTPLHCALRHGLYHTAEEVAACCCGSTARCLLQAASAVQPALDACVGAGPHSATLYADLAARLPLSQEQWSSIPAPCPDLARALPTVLQRSAAEAGWLVGRLAEGQRKRLRAAALSLARAQRGVPSLPAELCGRILALCLLDP